MLVLVNLSKRIFPWSVLTLVSPKKQIAATIEGVSIISVSSSLFIGSEPISTEPIIKYIIDYPERIDEATRDRLSEIL